MTRLRTSLLAILLLAIPACGALKDALTAHSDVVARAGNQELSVSRLAQLMANSEVPLRPDVARTIAQIWVNYQLLGQAGAHGDTLGTLENADLGMWSAIAQLRTRKYYELVSKDWAKPDSAAFEKAYNDGELLAASHILLAKQPEGFGATANDSIRREAERLATQVTSANFADLARRRSQDPGSKDRGGDYGVFPRGQMVGEFDAGILAVQPGQITKVVETQFGYHIIRRHTYAEVREQFGTAYEGMFAQRAESVFFAALERDVNVQVKESAPKLVKAIAEDIDAYRDDRTVIATSRRGNLSAERLAQWMAAFPPQSQMRGQVLEAPDSLIPLFVKNIMRSELLLKSADSAKITLDSTETADIRAAFFGGVVRVMTGLQLAPAQLAEAGDDEAARERLAATRVEEYITRLIRNEGQYVEVPEQVALVLRDRFESRVVPAGLDRALAEATALRAKADSTATGGVPSAVPVPGAPMTGAPMTGAPMTGAPMTGAQAPMPVPAPATKTP